MRALVLERTRELALRELERPTAVGPADVKVRIHTVGICGSDVHFYLHGGAGRKVVREPMVLGHEASGVVAETGSHVSHLSVGDRVCMEPGVPDLGSKAARLGRYNVDPGVAFWATPPVHGCLTPVVVHPAAFTFRLPDRVSFAEGALIEPFAVGVHAATKAAIRPGDRAVVLGAGTIGIMVALAALAAGCSQVVITDLHDAKLSVAGTYDGIVPVNVTATDLGSVVSDLTGGWGADIVFEASGSSAAYAGIVELVAPGGGVVFVGLPQDPVELGIRAAINKEIRFETVYRYANDFERALSIVASGKVDLRRLVTETFPFESSIAAFERAASGQPGDVKIQIRMPDAEP